MESLNCEQLAQALLRKHRKNGEKCAQTSASVKETLLKKLKREEERKKSRESLLALLLENTTLLENESIQTENDKNGVFIDDDEIVFL